MLAAPLTREASRTVLIESASSESASAFEAGFRELETRARTELIDEGADATATVTERWVDARYRGQSFELKVPADGWQEAFHQAHESRYGYARRGAPVEAVTLRALARCPGPPLNPVALERAKGPPRATSGRVRFHGRDLEAARVWRSDLRAGHVLQGPAIIQEYSATTWLPPDWRLEVDGWGTLHLVPDAAMFSGRDGVTEDQRR
jgi:N-methylhydantoinase A